MNKAKVNGVSPTLLALDDEHRAALKPIAEAGYPQEVCGLLIGRQEDGTVRVHEVTQARNLNQERAHDRFDLDPEDFLAADRAATDAGLEIVGIWHTHPDCPAEPSVTDHAAAWDGYSYLIVSVRDGCVVDFRSWRLDGDGFTEEWLGGSAEELHARSGDLQENSKASVP